MVIDERPPVDPFLQEVASVKERADAQVEAASRDYERELEARFGEDAQRLERLSRFARDNELDKALVALWEETKPYVAWSQRKEPGEWNILGLTDITGSHKHDAQTIEFTVGVKRFRLTTGDRYGTDGIDLSFFEDEDEVFSIRCVSVHEFTAYEPKGIYAIKKRGTWAKLLLEYYAQIQIKWNKIRAERQYDEVKKTGPRFEE
jgi:hypothetical protein